MSFQYCLWVFRPVCRAKIKDKTWFLLLCKLMNESKTRKGTQDMWCKDVMYRCDGQIWWTDVLFMLQQTRSNKYLVSLTLIFKKTKGKCLSAFQCWAKKIDRVVQFTCKHMRRAVHLQSGPNPSSMISTPHDILRHFLKMAEAHRLILSVCASLSVVLLSCCLGMWTQRGRPSCLLPGRKTPGQARVVARDRTLHNGLHYDTWCAARRSTLRLLFIAQRARSGVELIYVPQSDVTGGGVEGSRWWRSCQLSSDLIGSQQL